MEEETVTSGGNHHGREEGPMEQSLFWSNDNKETSRDGKEIRKERYGGREERKSEKKKRKKVKEKKDERKYVGEKNKVGKQLKKNKGNVLWLGIISWNFIDKISWPFLALCRSLFFPYLYTIYNNVYKYII